MKQKDHNMHNQDLGNEEKEINELLADDRAIIERVAAVNVDKAWKKILYRKRSRTIFMAAKKQLKYAAVILLLVMAGYYMASYKINQEDQHVYTTFNIPNAEMGNVILPDGTQVKLNSSSELKYPLNFLSS
ncbi:MAG: hypothetical protein PHI28_19640, partial [Mangrovibacterium sp.]|nr:hypothetical protein [Mangrovibacterium sp.]